MLLRSLDLLDADDRLGEAAAVVRDHAGREVDRDALARAGVVAGGIEAGAAVELVGAALADQRVVARTARVACRCRRVPLIRSLPPRPQITSSPECR